MKYKLACDCYITNFACDTVRRNISDIKFQHSKQGETNKEN